MTKKLMPILSASQDATCVFASSQQRPISAPISGLEKPIHSDLQQIPRHVHMGEAKHSRVKSIPCPHCQKMFSRKGHMTEHVRTVHEGKKRIYKKVEPDPKPESDFIHVLNIPLVGEL